MATLTAEDTFSIGELAEPNEDSVTVTVISPQVFPLGKGRLSHPVLGVYDYEIAPTEWENFDYDIIIPPVWGHERTLTGNASTRWSGYIGDLEVVERWIGSVALRKPQFMMMMDFWQNPPTTGNIVWSPSYANNNSYNVQIVSLSSGGSSGVTLDYTSVQGDGFVKGPVQIVYKVLSKV